MSYSNIDIIFQQSPFSDTLWFLSSSSLELYLGPWHSAWHVPFFFGVSRTHGGDFPSVFTPVFHAMASKNIHDHAGIQPEISVMRRGDYYRYNTAGRLLLFTIMGYILFSCATTLSRNDALKSELMLIEVLELAVYLES